MNKAFTKENDDEDLDPVVEISMPQVRKNYMTPKGWQALKDELSFLVHKDRPEVVNVVNWAAGNGDRSENGDYIYGKRRLREIDRRIRFLTKRLEEVLVVDPETREKTEQIFFGATVTIERAHLGTQVIKIVGVDELDLSKGKISWVSPLAKALIKQYEGDVILFRTPDGEEEVEIISVAYIAID